MRIALACDWFLKYATAQGAALARAGAEVLLLCRTHAIEFGGDEGERELALATGRGGGGGVAAVPNRLWDPRAAPELLRVRAQIARFSPQLVHAHDGADPRLLPLLARVP